MNDRRFSRIYLLLIVGLLLASSVLITFAQTDPEETAVPYPVNTPLSTPINGYPDNGQLPPPTITPANPTPYPVFTNTPAATRINVPVVGDNSDSNLPRATAVSTPPLTRGEMIQSGLVLWLGFLIGLLILGTGIYGAIILYMRK